MNLNLEWILLWLGEIDALARPEGEGDVEVILYVEQCISFVSERLLEEDYLGTRWDVGIAKLKVDSGELVFDVVEIGGEFGLDAVEFVEVEGAVVLFVRGCLWVSLQMVAHTQFEQTYEK